MYKKAERQTVSFSPDSALTETEKKKKNRKDLRPRLLSALVLLPLVLWALAAGGLVWSALILLGIALTGYEWSGLCGFKPWRPVFWAIVPVIACAALIAFLFHNFEQALGILAIGTLLCLILAVQNKKIFWLIPGIIYLGLAGTALIWLREERGGLLFMAFIFAAVWGADTGAYFVGRKIGGPKLAPKISPGKTVSGAIGGLVIGTGLSFIVFWCGHGIKAAAGYALLIGAITVLFSQAGDLGESWLKRRFGVKDSGKILPGHGGIFDRVDGLLPAALIFALWVFWMGKGAGLWHVGL